MDGADFGLRILNPDGSEAEKSGNGLRIFAKYLHDHGHAKKRHLHGGHQGRTGRVHLPRVDGRMNLVTVEMGRCTFVAPEIPMNGPEREVVKVPLQVDGETLLITAVSVGQSPLRDLHRPARRGAGAAARAQVEHHPSFPNRINVQWARVAVALHGRHPHLGARGRLDARVRLVVERGARAPRSGTGSATTASSRCGCRAAS